MLPQGDGLPCLCVLVKLGVELIAHVDLEVIQRAPAQCGRRSYDVHRLGARAAAVVDRATEFVARSGENLPAFIAVEIV